MFASKGITLVALCSLIPSAASATESAASSLVVVGLPRSGSESIHSFFQCLDSTYSSIHYCCDPSPIMLQQQQQAQQQQERQLKRRKKKPPPPFTAARNATLGTHFPCPHGQIPCGECVHTNLLHNRPALDGCHDRRDDTTPAPNRRRRVYARWDVETAQPYSWFLPQHFALPLLLEEKSAANAAAAAAAAPNHSPVVWILNQRGSADQWATNVLHWYSDTRRLLHSFQVPYHDPADDDWDASTMAAKVSTEAASSGVTWTDADRDWYMELERSYQRAHSTRGHERRKAALMDIYTKHATKVQDFVQSLAADTSPWHVPRLIRLNVDDANAGVELANALGLDLNKAQACWSFDASALDNDWQNFTLPL